MKNIEKETEKIYLEKYDVYVNKYLTYAQIQQIVNSTLTLMNTVDENGVRHNSWADRQQNIDMLMLYHATNLTEEELQTPHYILLHSGLIEEVRYNIWNYYVLDEAFEYEERWDNLLLSATEKIKSLIQISDIKKIREDVKNGESTK